MELGKEQEETEAEKTELEKVLWGVADRKAVPDPVFTME